MPTLTSLDPREGGGLGGLLSVPSDAEPVPLLLFLHGRGEAGTNRSGTRQPPAVIEENESPVASPAATEHFSIAAPQAPAWDTDNVWRDLIPDVHRFVGSSLDKLVDRHDGRIFVAGFSQGAFAAAEYVAEYTTEVCGWIGADAFRGDPVDPAVLEGAFEVHHRLIAGPYGFGRAEEEPRPDLTHPEVCQEVFSGRHRNNGGNVYEWLLDLPHD